MCVYFVPPHYICTYINILLVRECAAQNKNYREFAYILLLQPTQIFTCRIRKPFWVKYAHTQKDFRKRSMIEFRHILIRI